MYFLLTFVPLTTAHTSLMGMRGGTPIKHSPIDRSGDAIDGILAEMLVDKESVPLVGGFSDGRYADTLHRRHDSSESFEQSAEEDFPNKTSSFSDSFEQLAEEDFPNGTSSSDTEIPVGMRGGNTVPLPAGDGMDGMDLLQEMARKAFLKIMAPTAAPELDDPDCEMCPEKQVEDHDEESPSSSQLVDVSLEPESASETMDVPMEPTLESTEDAPVEPTLESTDDVPIEPALEDSATAAPMGMRGGNTLPPPMWTAQDPSAPPEPFGMRGGNTLPPPSVANVV